MATQFSVSDGRKWKAPFFTIWTGQAFSLLGSQLVQFALIWHLTITTGSAKVLAFAAIVGLLPQILLGPIIGTLVDRWNRRVVMVVADTVTALATLILAILFAVGDVEVWHIYLIMFFRSLATGFHGSSMFASTSLMVPKEHLTRIQGINQMLNGGLNVAAAPLGAFLLSIMPMQNILYIDIGTAVLAVAPLLFISVPQPEITQSEDKGVSLLISDLREGYRYIVSWPGLVILMVMFMLLNLLITPAFSLLPLLVNQHFGLGAIELGWLEAVVGVGFIIGGLVLSVWGGFKRRVATALMGLIGLGIGLVVNGVLPPSGFYLALAGGFLIGTMMPMIDGPLMAIVQSAVNPEMQGRVMNFALSSAKLMTPIGLGLAGPIADTFSIQTWYLVGGAACILTGFVGYLIPVLMNIEKEKDKNAEENPADA